MFPFYQQNNIFCLNNWMFLFFFFFQGAGLNNSGNTCFIASVLQCLTHTVPLLHSLRSYKYHCPCNCKLVDFWVCVSWLCAYCLVLDDVLIVHYVMILVGILILCVYDLILGFVLIVLWFDFCLCLSLFYDLILVVLSWLCVNGLILIGIFDYSMIWL